MTNVPRDRFLDLHRQLEEWSATNEAKCLSERTVDPATATAEMIWPVLWDKPFFTNRGDSFAKKWKKDIRTATNGTKAEIDCAWQTWGDPAVLNIRHVTKGKGRSDECFEVDGAEAHCLKIRDPKVPPLCRLYAIQGAAEGLRSLTEGHRHPFKDFPNRSLSEVVKKLKCEFGWGWGDATILHALTDMGLAVKPDRHLKNTMRELGLECEDPIKINEDACRLREQINSSELVASHVSLRYIDKVLMDISRVGIISQSD